LARPARRQIDLAHIMSAMQTEPPSGIFTLTILPLGRTVPIMAQASILEAAEQGGLRLPSSCRNGTCRACICRLQEGSVAYRTEWPGLSSDEKDEGWILPCVAMPRADLVIDQPAASAAPVSSVSSSATDPASALKRHRGF
jgi:ferredoxin